VEKIYASILEWKNLGGKNLGENFTSLLLCIDISL
jgi:hypothetical protein